METIDNIPISKVKRASKLITTGAKVGANYLKYYGSKVIGDEEKAREKLNEANAEDIYDSLKNLKGSALKVAQMLSMEQNILPEAYVEKFSLAQFSVPPLSPALVSKTFRNYFGKSPSELYDSFDSKSTHAASIGQVHQAELNGEKLAVKIQYPGVADSISSDLAMVKPVAIRMFNLKGKDSDKYFKEVEQKLMDETNYRNELAQSIEVAEACKHIPNIRFPKFYKDYSTDRILTMSWMDGIHLSEFAKVNKDPEKANRIGQALWDFYMYQIHVLKKVHADPHPGNFLVDDEGNLIVLDFGCMKEIPDDFYDPYFELADNAKLNDPSVFEEKLYELEILKTEDTDNEKEFFSDMFHGLLTVFTRPFNNEVFDFADKRFFAEIAQLGEGFARETQKRKLNGNRGSKHFLYVNRTFFGLYNLLHQIGASHVKIGSTHHAL